MSLQKTRQGTRLTLQHLRLIILVRISRLGDRDFGAHLDEVGARGEVGDATRHNRQQLWPRTCEHSETHVAADGGRAC